MANQICELTRQDVLDLVRHIRLETGEITITLHNGDAAKVDVALKLRVPLRQKKGQRKVRPRTSLCLDGLESLVLTRFEEPIRNKVGEFGGLQIKVVNDRLENWGFFDSRK